MRIFIYSLFLISQPVFSQDYTTLINAILELNSPKAIQESTDIASNDLEGQFLLHLAWKQWGNDGQSRLYAERCVRLASKQNANTQNYFKAHLLLSQYKTDEAISLFSELAFEKLDKLQKLFLLKALLDHNQASEKTTQQLASLAKHFEADSPLILTLRAKNMTAKKDYVKALKTLEKLSKLPSPYARIKAHYETGKVLILKNKNEMGMAEFQKAFSMATEIKDHLAIAEIADQISLNHARSGKFNLAMQMANLGVFSARLVGNKFLEYQLNNLLSWSNFSLGTSFGKSLQHHEKQFNLANKISSDPVIANVYNNLGYDLTVAGTVPIDSTIQLMHRANDIYAKTEKSHGRWYTLMNLVWQYRLKGDYQKSIAFGIQSVEEARRIKDRHAIIEAAFQLGESHLATNQIDKAKPYYDEASKWAGEKPDRDKYVHDIYRAKFDWESGGNRTQAIKMLEEASGFLKSGEVFYEMHARAILADYYLQQGNTDASKEQIEIISNPRRDYISFETQVMAAITKAKILKMEGNQQKASALLRSHLVQAQRIKATLLSKQISKALKSLEN